MNTKNIGFSIKEKMTLLSNMQTMLSAGIPILETVDSLHEDAKGNVKKFLVVLKNDLIQGQKVASTLAKFPKVFDKVTVNIIKASEEAGNLDTALSDIKDNIKKQSEFNDKIKSALIYPMFIMVVFTIVFTLILVVVIPKISGVFKSLQVTLPLPTKIMIAMSDALVTKPIPIALSVFIIISIIVFAYKKSKKVFIEVLTSFPLISQLAIQADLTRFTRSLYLLLSAGLPITNALELTQEVVVKEKVRRVIIHTKNLVFGGKRLSEGLKDHKEVIPAIMIKIIEAGERTGTLDKSMQDISDYLDYEVSNSLKTLTAFIEPLLLVVIGGLIGGMMMAIISPIYGVIGQVGR